MFKNREHAGKLLVQKFKDKLHSIDNLLVIGLPRGGIPVAYQLAKELNVPLETLSVKKIGVPDNPELAIGAVTEEGGLCFNHDIIRHNRIDESTIGKLVIKAQISAQKQGQELRQGRVPDNYQGRNILLVDDGIATGATIKAAIKFLREHEAHKIIAMVPVCSYASRREISSLVDEFYAIDTPYHFYAVGSQYRDFDKVQVKEVIAYLNKAEAYRKKSSVSEKSIDIQRYENEGGVLLQ